MRDVLQRLCQGQLKVSELPAALEVWDLKAGYDQLRQSAFAEGVEWGACVVWESEQLRIQHTSRGWASGVNSACDPPCHATYAGFLHVHLPAPETNKPYLGFSDRDFRATLADGDNLALVTNGEEVFALVRVTDATLAPQVIDGAEFKEWERMYGDCVAAARGDPAGEALNRGLWKVNRELCRRLGLAFYRGLWGEPLECVYKPLRRRVER